MQADFGIRYEPDSDFVDIWGGEVIGGVKGCGTLLSGETLYFSDVSSLRIKVRRHVPQTLYYKEIHKRRSMNVSSDLNNKCSAFLNL